MRKYYVPRTEPAEPTNPESADEDAHPAAEEPTADAPDSGEPEIAP